MIDIEAIHERMCDYLPEKIAVDQGVEMEFKNQEGEEEMLKDGKSISLDGLAQGRLQEEHHTSILKSIGDVSLDELSHRVSGSSQSSQTNNSKQNDEIDKTSIAVRSETDEAEIVSLRGT